MTRGVIPNYTTGSRIAIVSMDFQLLYICSVVNEIHEIEISKRLLTIGIHMISLPTHS